MSKYQTIIKDTQEAKEKQHHHYLEVKAQRSKDIKEAAEAHDRMVEKYKSRRGGR